MLIQSHDKTHVQCARPLTQHWGTDVAFFMMTIFAVWRPKSNCIFSFR